MTRSFYLEAVNRKVESVAADVQAGRAVDGWAKGPVRICEEMADETVDISGWAQGLGRYDMTPEQLGLLDTITSDAGMLFEAIRRLKETYECE